MAQGIGPEQPPENEGLENPAGDGIVCSACRGRGRKFTTLRRMVDAAGGSSETDLLKRTQTECLGCSGEGRVPA
jgi:hypothetical protein